MNRYCLYLLFIISGYALAETADLSLPFSSIDNIKQYEKSSRHFEHYQFIIGRDGDKQILRKESGKLSRVAYKIPSNYTAENILNNYTKQLNGMNGEILYRCDGEEACGRYRDLQEIINPFGYSAKHRPSYLSAKVSTKAKLFYVSILAIEGSKNIELQVDIVEKMDEPLNLISSNPDFLNKTVVEYVFKDNSKADIKEGKDHPMLSRLPGSKIADYKEHGYVKNQLLVGIDKGKFRLIDVDGKTTRIGYSLPRNYSEYEVLANYQAALTKMGFEKIFTCEGKDCGSEIMLRSAIKAFVYPGRDASQQYGLYHLKRREGDVWVVVYVIGANTLGSNLHIIEETALVDDRVTIDLEALNNAIETQGHVALDGLLFQYDSDEILAESEELLKVLADYLSKNKDKLFYVVGHTDDQGKQAYNEQLSTKRATKVAHILVNQYGIDKKQLVAKGVGEWSPIASNLNDAGKQKNRRVELVIRSDDK